MLLPSTSTLSRTFPFCSASSLFCNPRRPSALVKRTRADVIRFSADVRITEEEYTSAIKAEIEKVIRLQEQLGLDVLVHGEPEVGQNFLG